MTAGQLAFELEHLRAKVTVREPAWLPRVPEVAPAAPSLVVIPGGIEPWERATPAP